MKNEIKYLKKKFGLNEEGFADIPVKYSNVKISRLINGEDMGCTYCFPHGQDTINSKWGKGTRSWKLYRDNRWK
jgi:hypothetical protein